MCFPLTGYEVAVGNFYFFIQGIAVKHQHFHPVTQRRWNGVQDVGCCDEHDVGKIEGNVQIMIGERKVLFRIQHFQQCRRRITAKIAADLVDFIQHEYRIVRFGTPQSLYDSPGKCPDIGAPVSPDFSFVTHTAERNAVKLAPQGPGNGLPQRCFTRSGRSGKTQNRSF